MAPQMDLQNLRQWIGRHETRTERIESTQIESMAATLEAELDPPDELPPLWHWMYNFLPMVRAGEVGADGHPKRGGFLPPVPLPRRMWAGSRVRFLRPIRIGDAMTRSSTIDDVQIKTGRSGTLVFVTLSHRFSVAGTSAIEEQQDVVYREAAPAQPAAAAPAERAAPVDTQFERQMTPDPVLLFRYSALTFNGHRIHYDRSYATGVEGYPGLVVHGPLIATLLADLARRHLPGSRLTEFEFRAIKPLFDLHPFSLCGRRDAAPEHGGRHQLSLWAKDHVGAVTMQAVARLTD